MRHQQGHAMRAFADAEGRCWRCRLREGASLIRYRWPRLRMSCLQDSKTLGGRLS